MSMQAKDVPEAPVLAFLLANAGRWCTYAEEYFDQNGKPYLPSVAHAMPAGTPEKVQLAKMRQLMKRGLVTGCGCGCRGDFEITEAGRAYLAALQAVEPRP